MDIVQVSEGILEAVLEIYEKEKRTLGFFPRGAFEEFCRKGQVVAAVEGDSIFGFLTFRLSGERCCVVHLCVTTNRRGRGVARCLIEFLENSLDPHCRAIHVRCRRDYDASTFWPKLGFVAIREQCGRGNEANELTDWILDLNRPTLFSESAHGEDSATLSVAIDAQIFLDLEVSDRPNGEESRSLTVDWISESVRLFVTDEMLNEINRVESPERRVELRRKVKRYPAVQSEAARFRSCLREVEEVLGPGGAERDKSDRRHVAQAIAGDMEIFSTRDQGILGYRDQLYERFSLQVLHPVDVLIQLDNLQEGVRYSPGRLSGTLLSKDVVHSGDADALARDLHDSGDGERLRDLTRRIRSRADPRFASGNLVVRDQEARTIALMTLGRSRQKVVEVTFLRAVRSRLRNTLLGHLIQDAISRSVSRGAVLLSVKEDLGVPGFILESAGFILSGDEWVKVVLPRPETLEVILRDLENLHDSVGQKYRDIIVRLQQSLAERTSGAIAREIDQVERLIWPAFVVDAAVPSFIVPIRPMWAKDLFDVDLASRDLFGAESELLLRKENVYYRSAKPNVLEVPARVLWYVSKGADRRGDGSAGAVKAYSQLREVAIGSPSLLFRRFRRLGVYEWRHLLQQANNDAEKDLMAMKVGATKVFSESVEWDTLQEILERNGCRNQIQSPVQIDQSCLRELLGCGFPRSDS